MLGGRCLIPHKPKMIIRDVFHRQWDEVRDFLVTMHLFDVFLEADKTLFAQTHAIRFCISRIAKAS